MVFKASNGRSWQCRKPENNNNNSKYNQEVTLMYRIQRNDNEQDVLKSYIIAVSVPHDNTIGYNRLQTKYKP